MLWGGRAMRSSLPTSAELWGGGFRESGACWGCTAHRLPCSVAARWGPNGHHFLALAPLPSPVEGIRYPQKPFQWYHHDCPSLLPPILPCPECPYPQSDIARFYFPPSQTHHGASELLSEPPRACLFLLSCKRHTVKPSWVRLSRCCPEEGPLL